jgi:glycerophosphoryl diester phosphodiesterase
MKRKALQGYERPLLFAHRGVSSLAPENTMAAFALAMEMKIPGIELDVHLCKSGELLVIHDSSFARTGRLTVPENNTVQIPAPDAKIEDLTYSQVQLFDVGIWKDSKFKGEKVHTLAEVLSFLDPQIYVDIEIKTEVFDCKEIAQVTAQVINKELRERPENPNRYIVSSFNPVVLRHFRKYSKIPTAIIYANDSGVPSYLRKGEGSWIGNTDLLKPCWKDYDIENSVESAINSNSLQKNKIPLAKINKRRKKSWFWTVDTKETALELMKNGAEALISNRPQDLLPLLGK